MTQRALILMSILAALMPATYAATSAYWLECTPTTVRIHNDSIFATGFDYGTQARKP